MDRDIIDVRSANPSGRCELSYLAGLIDGEAHLGFHHGKYFRIIIQMTDEPTIDWLHHTFGGHKYFRGRVKSHYKDQWGWQIHGHKAIELYMRIYKFLRIKRLTRGS